MKLDSFLPLAVIAGAAYILTQNKTQPTSPGLGGSPDGSMYAATPNVSPGFEDGGQSTIPSGIIDVPKYNLGLIPASIKMTEPTAKIPLEVTPVQSTTGGAIPGTTETTISNVRLTPSGITPDPNFKVSVTSVGSVKETFSSQGFDAFGTKLPIGERSDSKTKVVSTSSGAPIPVVENGVVNYYSPAAFAMTYGNKK